MTEAISTTWETGTAMTILPVIPTSPDRPDTVPTRRRVSMPPRHLADLDLAARGEAVKSLGEPAFRARQISTHYFGRLVRDAEAMTDLPAASRARLTGDLLP
jgi:23S rRNA (adenine2503-C2)-methyltransferase